MSRRNIILIAACLVGAVLLGATAWKAGVFQPAGAAQGATRGSALVGGPFKLVDQDGRAVDVGRRAVTSNTSSTLRLA